MDGELRVSSAPQTGYKTGYKSAAVIQQSNVRRGLQDEFWFNV